MKKLFSPPPTQAPQNAIAEAQEALDLARQLAKHPSVQKISGKSRSAWIADSSKYDRPADIPVSETPNETSDKEKAKAVEGTIAFLQKALEHQAELEAQSERKPLQGLAFQEALANHPLWGQYPAYLRPQDPDQMRDINLLRKAQSWQRRKESLPTVDENRPQRVADLPLELRPKIYRPIKCQTCKDQKVICRGWLNEYRRHIVPCPDCAVKERLARMRRAINRRWGIDEQCRKIANIPWLSDINKAADQARAAQQQIMEEMPSPRTLFLYGVVGVGKSRLLAEIALVARQRGLSSILKTAKRVQDIIQDFPLQNEPPAARAKKQRRLTQAREDLRSADVLLIDELDDVTGRYFQGELLEILNHRLGHGLTTCFAANASKYERKDKDGVVLVFTLDFLSDPIKDRLLAKGNLHINMCKDKGLRNFAGV